MFVLINIIFYTIFTVKYSNCLQEDFLVEPNVGRAIINGKEASIEWYPSIVGLMRSSRQPCGGTIIGRDVVLTAAHCIHSRSLDNLAICAGANYKNCRDGKIYSTKASIIHPEFNLELLDNDFALLQVTEEFVLSVTARIARLVSAPVEPGSIVYAIGWGGGEYSGEKLQDIKLRVISQSDCKKRLPYNNISESMLCTFNKFGRDTCDGDSGGPLFYQGQLAGVTSWGIKCGLSYPSMYSNVFYARKWIEESMKQFLSTNKGGDSSSSDKKIDSTLSRTNFADPLGLAKPTLATNVDAYDSKSIQVEEESSSSSEDLDASGSDKEPDSTNQQPTLSASKVADPITLEPNLQTNVIANDSKSIQVEEESSSSSEDLDASDSDQELDSKNQQPTLSITNVADPISSKPTLATNVETNNTKNIVVDEDSSSSSEDLD